MQQDDRSLAEDAPVTILFTDVEGSTALQSGRGDRAARALVERSEMVIRDEVEARGGRVVKLLGDGVLAAFGSPRRAVASAVAINRQLATRAQGDERVRLRFGLHTGEVLVEDDDVHGAAVS